MAEEVEVPILSRLRPPEGAVRDKRRKGRGTGSGLGKTSGKGMKGMKARHANKFGKLGFEGGQTPLQRRLPKIGFNNIHAKRIAAFNVSDLEVFEPGSVVDEDQLRERGILKRRADGVKILGHGELSVALTVRADAFSASAKAKIEQAGGTAVLVGQEANEPQSDE